MPARCSPLAPLALTSGGSKEKETYDASQIQVLEGLDAVRKRPGMYIGGTGPEGLHHLVWEIIDNGVDEAAAGSASHIEVILHRDGSIEVSDDGRGIPVDKSQTVVRRSRSFHRTTRRQQFGSGAYGASGGLHGVGASVVNVGPESGRRSRS
ncbi:MAG: ATP-binding protein [Acidimicrobiales bacterium]